MFYRGHKHPGFFVSFEGGEGCGKDTHHKRLVEHLTEQGYLVSQGREPGTTDFGKRMREIVMDPSIPEVNSRTELLLYTAARSEFVDLLVRPTLERGEIFAANRFKDSSKAYQGYAGGTSLKTIDKINDFAIDGINPDLTVLIDIDAEEGLRMLSGGEFNGAERDKIEARTLEYHRKVNQGYLEMARLEPYRFRVVKYTSGQVDAMQNEIRQHVHEFLERRGLDKTLARARAN